MRRGGGRLITEIRRAPVEKPGRSRHFDKSNSEKNGIRHTRYAAPRAVAMPATIGIGWAILTGVDVVARVVRRRRTVVVVYQPGILMPDGHNILNPFRAMRGKRLQRQSREPKKQGVEQE